MRPAVGIVVFLIAALGLFIYSQTATVIMDETAPLDPLAVESNFTPAVIPELAQMQEITPPYDDAKALQVLDTMVAARQRLEVKGLPTEYMRDTFLEAKKAYNGEDVTKVVAEIMLIKDEKQRNKTLSVLNLTPTTTKINTDYMRTVFLARLAVERAQLLSALQERTTLLNHTLGQVNREVYNLTEMDQQLADITHRLMTDKETDTLGDEITHAYKRLDELFLEQSRARVLLKASQRTIRNFIIVNWKFLLAVLVLLTVIGVIAVNEIRLHETDRKINDLHIERETLTSLLKKVQEQRYIEKKISVYEYKTKLDHYKARLTQIQHTLPVVLVQKGRLQKYRRYYLPYAKD